MARRTPSVLRALTVALKAQPAADADAATVALAKRYAVELDDANLVSRTVLKALEKVRDLDTELHYELSVLASRIEEAHVAALIGPKLLATLEQLQLTPKARAGVLQGGGAPGAGNSKLDELRSRRENRAKTVDPTTS